jgi:hypothetical protein
MRREKSGCAFHLDWTSDVRFNQPDAICRHFALNKHAIFRPDARRFRDDLEMPLPRFTLLSDRREEIQ